MRKFLFLVFIGFNSFTYAQELNCTIKVGSEIVANSNLTVFKTLEKSLNELVNKTKWTNLNFKNKERIECSMFLNIVSYSNDAFTGTIQIQSTRPVFNANYQTPIFNYNDKDLGFKYIEYEPIFYNATSFDSNLISIIAFYATMIIALDADSFAPLGGTEVFENAKEIVSIAQQSGQKGWNQSDGNQNRYFLVTDALSAIFSPYRESLYNYHYLGLDTMSEDIKTGKDKIKNAIDDFQKIQNLRPNAFLTRVFFDAKSDEIVSIFSGGPKMDITNLIDFLTRVSPTNSAKWANIKY